jgi:inner membrane protein
VGAALARTSLGKRTTLGATTLIVGANFPDLDVIAYFAGPGADLEWRRGWSHGVLALAVLPFVLTGLLLSLHRATGRRRQWSVPSAVEPKQLLLLSFIAIGSHPILDGLNTYGVRWLMPFSGEWFYGDTLFIIDPWIWLALMMGMYWTARREKARRGNPTRPARMALAVVALYAAGMALSGRAARSILSREVASGSGVPVQAAMAGPVPINPLVRDFVVKQEGRYLVGTFRWLEQPHVNAGEVLTFSSGRPAHPAVQVAAESPLGRRFLGWARFPVFEVQPVGKNRFVVDIIDLRYARGPGEAFGTVSVPVTLAE